MKFLLCVFKSLVDVQPVKIDQSIGATLAAQEGIKAQAAQPWHLDMTGRCTLFFILKMILAAFLFRNSAANFRARASCLCAASALYSLLLHARLAFLYSSFSSRFKRRAFSRRSSAVDAPLTISSSSENTPLGRLSKEDSGGASFRMASRRQGLIVTSCRGSPEEED